MRIERGEPAHVDRIKDVVVGDSVIVHLSSNLNAAMFSEVVAVREHRLSLKVHAVDGALTVEGEPDFPWHVVLPWSSIGFLRHSGLRVVDDEGGS